MIGKIHYGKHNHVRVVAENNRVYYTDLIVENCIFTNRQRVAFDVIDDKKSIVGNIHSL